MAINFLNNVDLNKNQLIKAAIESQPNDAAAGTGVEGQLYFNTTVDALKIYAGGAWVEVGATSGVESLTTTDGTYINLTPNSATIGNVTVTADLSAVDGTSIASDRFLTKNNKWATIPFGDITEVQGGTYISVTNQTGPIPIVNHDLTSRSNTTSTAAPGYGATFTALDSITTNTTGHVTAVNTKTVTIPASDNTNTTYTLPTSAGAANTAVVTLTPGGSGGGGGSVTFSGTADQIRVSEATGANGTVTIGFPDDVTIESDLTVLDNVTLSGGNLSVTGTGSFTGQVTVPTATASTSAPNLGQVELLIAGVGIFQGSYNAATNTPALEGGSNIALDTGDYFVVSVSGSFLGEAVEPGDFIFANVDITAGSSPPLSKYTVVQADDNVAGAGASDGATQKGVSGFDSDHFTVSSNGWVQLKPQSNANAARVVLNSGLSYVTRAEAGGLTTFTVSVSDSSLFGAGAVGQNTKAEVTENSGDYETVYAGISRSGGTIIFEFKGSVANSAYATLLSYV